MSYKLFEGDCLEVMPTLASKSIDAIIADWPYGTTACKWDSIIPLDLIWKECKRVVRDKGVVILFGSQPFTSELIMSNRKWFRYECVWNKVNRFTGMLNAKKRPLLQHEAILIFSHGWTTYNPQYRQGVPYKT